MIAVESGMGEVALTHPKPGAQKTP